MKKFLLCLFIVYVSLNGQKLDIKNLPPGYETIKIVRYEDLKYMQGIISGDIWSTYPELSNIYTTDLERQIFLESSKAESLKTLLKLHKLEILEKVYIVEMDFGTEYNIKKEAFMVSTGGFSLIDRMEEDITCDIERGKHIIEDIWFNYLPLDVYTSYNVEARTYLILKVKDKELALDVERERNNLKIWIGFKLTGNIRKIVYPLSGFPITEKFLEGKDAVVMLINKEKGEVVWRKKYGPPPTEK